MLAEIVGKRTDIDDPNPYRFLKVLEPNVERDRLILAIADMVHKIPPSSATFPGKSRIIIYAKKDSLKGQEDVWEIFRPIKDRDRPRDFELAGVVGYSTSSGLYRVEFWEGDNQSLDSYFRADAFERGVKTIELDRLYQEIKEEN